MFISFISKEFHYTPDYFLWINLLCYNCIFISIYTYFHSK